MTDFVAPETHTSSPEALHMLSQRATQFGIDPDRPFFPTNSLRLLYLMVFEAVGGEQAAYESLDTLVLRIEAILSARRKSQLSGSGPLAHLADAQGPLNDLTQLLADVSVDADVSSLFGYIMPFQDEQLRRIQAALQQQRTVTVDDVEHFLQVRALDSYATSAFLSAFILKHVAPPEGTSRTALAVYLHYQLHLIYQLNDLVDAIVFAREDMTAQSVGPLSIIQRITTEPAKVRELVRMISQRILQQSQTCRMEKLDPTMTLFHAALQGVIAGE